MVLRQYLPITLKRTAVVAGVGIQKGFGISLKKRNTARQHNTVIGGIEISSPS